MSGILMASVGNSYGSAPVNTVAPAVTGTATFGQTLSTTNGTWTGAPAPTFTYQWFRSPSTSISGATSSTYVLVAADVGFGIFCRVTATNSIAPSGVSADSNTTATVVAAVPGAPTIGTASVSVLTASVPFTAPASNGGATITTYTATSSPGGVTGTLSQAGSGTVTVSGLTANTSYTFTVTATNSAGTGPASAASNSVTTANVPGAPTIGTATATGKTTATVAYTAPASNGGSVITSYSAYDNNGAFRGSVSQAGSGTINLTGLTASTNYSFRVYARNDIGEGSPSSFSNTITTFAVTCATYTSPGTYTFVVPSGVTSVAAVAIGGGGGGNGGIKVNCCCGFSGGGGGSGAALAYRNSYSVTPGNSYTVVVGSAGSSSSGSCGTDGTKSTFAGCSVLKAQNGAGAQGYTNGAGPVGGSVGTAVGPGGYGGTGVVGAGYYYASGGGGGGAGGYSGSAGAQGGTAGAGAASADGGGGGGGAGYTNGGSCYRGAGGGGTGIYGKGSNGTAGSYNVSNNGGGGGGGSGGGAGGLYSGGSFGGGAGGGTPGRGNFGCAGSGAVRIVWCVGGQRGTPSFPSTNVGA